MSTLKLACRFWNRMAILAAILMLTGCFTSQSPLISPENADFLFQSITFVSVSESGENPEEINLTRDGDAYVELTREDEGQYLLVKVDTDLYVAQLTEANDDGELEVLYGIVQVQDNTVMKILSPTCDLTPEEMLKEVGIEKTDRQFAGECTVTSLDQLIRLARLLAAAETQHDTYRIIELVE